MRGIDPRTSRMLSERSTIWATSPQRLQTLKIKKNKKKFLNAGFSQNNVFYKQIFNESTWQLFICKKKFFLNI